MQARGRFPCQRGKIGLNGVMVVEDEVDHTYDMVPSVYLVGLHSPLMPTYATIAGTSAQSQGPKVSFGANLVCTTSDSRHRFQP
jgi:hypothetical protein